MDTQLTPTDRHLLLAGCDLEAVLAEREQERPDPAPEVETLRIETNEHPSGDAVARERLMGAVCRYCSEAVDE